MNWFRPKPRKVALVLGGGGARGLAHIGIINVLDREGFKPDLVVGTSMGAIVGAAYALRIPISKMALMATSVGWTDIFDPTLPKLGLIEGEKMEKIIAGILENRTFHDAAIPLAVVTTDIENAEEVVFTQGDLVKAVRASCSWPGIFNPVRCDGRLVVDGGIMNSVPVAIAKKFGADFIVACDVGFCVTKGVKIDNILRLIMQSFQIMGEELNTFQSKAADIIVEPDLDNIDQVAFDKATQIIAMGEQAAEKMVPALKKALRLKKNRTQAVIPAKAGNH